MVKKGNLTVQSSGRSLCTTFPIRKSVPQSAVNPQYNTDIPRKIILQTSRLLNTTRRNYGRATGKQKNVSPSAERTTFVVTLISLHIIQLNKICIKKNYQPSSAGWSLTCNSFKLERWGPGPKIWLSWTVLAEVQESFPTGASLHSAVVKWYN